MFFFRVWIVCFLLADAELRKGECNMPKLIFIRPSSSKFRDLHMNVCGYEECTSLCSMGPEIRPYYLIYIILNGKGIYTVGNRTYFLSAGDGFLVPPGVQTFYQADKENPWTYCWVGFEGEKAGEYLQDLGISGNNLIFHTGQGEAFRRNVFMMLKQNAPSKSNEYIVEGQMYHFFGLLLEEMDVISSDRDGGNRYVRKAVEYIQNRYSGRIRVSELASYLNLNRGYLYTLFMKEMGMSPREYLTNYRLTQAADLLETSPFSVEAVAASCGYQDPVVFSKAFRKMYGLSPMKYRQRSANQAKMALPEDEEGTGQDGCTDMPWQTPGTK